MGKNTNTKKAETATELETGIESKKCILTTSLASITTAYRSGDVYTGSVKEVDRLVDMNMAKPI